MRGFLLLILITAGCFASNGGTDCLGESPDRFFDPSAGQCIDVGSAEACQCNVGPGRTECIVGDAHDLDLAACDTCQVSTEQACIERSGCIAAYLDGSFDQCRTAAPSGPLHVGACVGLDAHQCSRHDNCALRYLRAADGSPMFERCADDVPPRRFAACDGG
jgi:hypothetical protein